MSSIKIAPLLIGMAMFLVAHILTFFQLNGQFLWKSFAKNEWLVAASGVFLSIFYIWGTYGRRNKFKNPYKLNFSNWISMCAGFLEGIICISD